MEKRQYIGRFRILLSKGNPGYSEVSCEACKRGIAPREDAFLIVLKEETPPFGFYLHVNCNKDLKKTDYSALAISRSLKRNQR